MPQPSDHDLRRIPLCLPYLWICDVLMPCPYIGRTLARRYPCLPSVIPHRLTQTVTRLRCTAVYRQAISAEQKSAIRFSSRELRSSKMVEAAKIEGEGGQSQHNPEPAQNRAKTEQNQTTYGTRKAGPERARKHLSALSEHKRDTSQHPKIVRDDQSRSTANAQRPGQGRGRLAHVIR